MSQNNFELIADRHPALRDALGAIQNWMVRSVGVRFLELARVARDLPSIPEEHLALALDVLCSNGIVKETFRVRGPDRILLPEDYDDPGDIPKKLTTMDDGFRFTLDQGEIVQGYLLERSRAAV